MLIIGLTGSIAMGKSTASMMLSSLGVPVYDSDASVHEFYRAEAAAILKPYFPDAIIDGTIDRKILSKFVINNPEKMALLESLVHPVVEKKRNAFIDNNRSAGFRIIAVDIPLLFEIGGVNQVNIIAVVSASENTQRTRALARDNMTLEKFEIIKAKQVPDSVKRKNAHFVVSSEFGFEVMSAQIAAMLRALR